MRLRSIEEPVRPELVDRVSRPSSGKIGSDSQWESRASTLRHRSHPNPASCDGVLDQVRISVDQPSRGRLASCRRFVFVFAMIATVPVPLRSHQRELARFRWSLSMSHDLSLAQSHAFQLSRDLMVPVTVFEVDGEYGVLPSDEIDASDDLEIIHEFHPFGAH